MPDDALPKPWPPAAPVGTVRYQYTWFDLLGRPMSGQVSFTGSKRTATDAASVLPAKVTVPLASGLLVVDLPPDVYEMVAVLRTADGETVREKRTVDLTSESP